MFRYEANDGNSYICFKMNTDNPGLQYKVLKFIDANRVRTQTLGWIPFFSSHGNQAVMSVGGQGTGIENDASIDANNGDIDTEKYLTTLSQSGLGATSTGAELVFDDEVSRFTLQNFYTPVISSNFYNFDGTTANQNPNAGNEIVSYNVNNYYYYKISTGYSYLNNPFPTGTDKLNFKIHNTFNEIFPYNYRETLGSFKGEGKLSLYYQQTGVAIDKWVEVKDPLTGIVYIEENETNFNNSIWKKLGFSYNQTHSNIIPNLVDGSDPLTTNLDFIQKYRNSSTINENGAIDNQKFYSIPITNNTDVLNVQFDNLLFENRKNFNMFLNNPANNVNSLEIISKSTIFLAENLPIRSSDPFFIIESDILNIQGISTYFSQNSIFNGIDIVEKSFNSNDYYIKDGGINHMISTPYTINNVTHQIRRSNGKLLNTNQFSSVIYLVTKKIIVGLTPEQIEEKEELVEQDQLKREKEQKIINELSNKKLNPKQQLLKKLLYKNIIEKNNLREKETTDDNLEDLYEEELDQEEEDEEDELPELEGDDENQTFNIDDDYNTIRVNRPITITQILTDPIGEAFDDLENEENVLDIDKIKEQILMDTPIWRNAPLFKTKKSRRKKKVTTTIINEPMENLENLKQEETLDKPKIIQSIKLPSLEEENINIPRPTFSDIKPKEKKTNIGRPKYKSITEKSNEPITKEQLSRLKENISRRVQGEKSIRESTQSKLENPYTLFKELPSKYTEQTEEKEGNLYRKY
jgi:hypothetical protein